MPPKQRCSKKQKSHHNGFNRNRNQSCYHNQLDSSSSATNENDIPGFYFDPVKNKYFKIQQNTFGVQNIPTNELIKKKLDKQELENECKKQLMKRNSLLTLMIKKEIYGANNQLKLEFTNNLIANSKLKDLVSFESNLTIKKIEVLSSDHFLNKKNMIYILVNFVGDPFSYKIFELCTDFFVNNENLSNNQLLNQVYFVEQSENGIITGPIEDKITNLPSYMVGKNHILSTFKSIDQGDNRPFKLKISQIASYDRESEFLIEIPKYSKSFKFPLWCSDVNKEMTRCAVGLHQGGEVNNLQDNYFFRLNTFRSDVYCIKFKPESQQVFTGCKNKFVFGYDLRCQVNNPILEIEHQSCVNDLVFCPKNSNYLFVNDFTGKVNLWDVRFCKQSIVKFTGVQNSNSRCSIKLDNSGNYLYLMTKDGHIKIFNTITSDLIRTVVSPEKKELDQLYSEIPSIHIFDDLSMLYGINNKLMHYSI